MKGYTLALHSIQGQWHESTYKEKHRLGSAGDNVIHAHCNQVDANRIVLVEVECKLQLGSYSVRPYTQGLQVACSAPTTHNQK